MNTEKAIDILEELQGMSIEHLTALGYKEEKQAIEEVINLIKTKQEMVTKFSSEVEEQQKNLDQIDLWAMEIQSLIKKIRGKI